MRFDIEDYITTNLQKVRPVDSGNGFEYTGVCPACDKYGGFYVNVDTGAYLCNKCQFKSISIIGLVSQIEDISWNEAKSFVFKKSIKIRRKSELFSLSDKIKSLRIDAIEELPNKPPTNVGVPEYYCPIYDSRRIPNWKIPKYLKIRKIKSETIKKWNLGFCTHGKYGGRLIIPIISPGGSSWAARAMSRDVSGPKYLNPGGAGHSGLVIGWDDLDIDGDFVLCEGPLDTVMLQQHGIRARGLGGKILHDKQLNQLMRFPKNIGVTIMLDQEEKNAPFEIAEKLSVYFDHIYIARFPNIKINGELIDPGNSPKRISQDVIESAKRWDGSRLDKLKTIILS